MLPERCRPGQSTNALRQEVCDAKKNSARSHSGRLHDGTPYRPVHEHFCAGRCQYTCRRGNRACQGGGGAWKTGARRCVGETCGGSTQARRGGSEGYSEEPPPGGGCERSEGCRGAREGGPCGRRHEGG